MADQALGGYDPNAGLSAHNAGRPQLIPVPSLLRALLSEHLDPGYAAAAEQRNRSGEPRPGGAGAMSWVWQALAALLVASVFAAAVAQARLVAPGVSAAQRVLAAGPGAWEGGAGGSPRGSARRSGCWRPACSPRRRRPASTPSIAIRLPHNLTTFNGTRWPKTPRASDCSPTSTGSAWLAGTPPSPVRV